MDTEKDVCSICFENFSLCATLPCSHKFCLLCIKTHKLRNANAQCPHCRAAITDDFFDTLTRDLDYLFQGKPPHYHWAYRSRNNANEWWLFDEQSHQKIETSYQEASCHSFPISLLGEMYTIDIRQGVQISHDGLRMRQIKKVFVDDSVWSSGVVGVAGMKHLK